jgi:hypothetical protein
MQESRDRIQESGIVGVQKLQNEDLTLFIG